ncbi:MAG: LysE family translocator [Vicinamibacterales bacterium]
MIDAATLLTFMLAGAAIIVAPGPAQALVLARTLSDGRRAGLLTAVGLNVGTLVHAAAAGLGASAILATSALAFDTVKFVGAAYLVFLGVQAWRQGSRPQAAPSVTSQQALTRAITTGILNPKVAVFFLAFLPQFVNPARGPILAQCLFLGTVLAAMDVVYEGGLVWLSGTLSSTFRHPRVQRWQHRFTGGVLIGLGARLALVERK